MKRVTAVLLVLSVWLLAAGLWVLVVKVDALEKLCHGPLSYTKTCVGYNIVKLTESAG